MARKDPSDNLQQWQLTKSMCSLMPCAQDVEVEAEIHYFILEKHNCMLGEDLLCAKHSLPTFLYCEEATGS